MKAGSPAGSLPQSSMAIGYAMSLGPPMKYAIG
jgi:hypothetical protein